MADLNGKEQAKITETATIAERNAKDIQTLFKITSQMGNELVDTKNKTSRNTYLLTTLIDDKQSVFKWAMMIIAGIVIGGSLVALGISNISI